VYVAEHVPDNKRGYYTSFIQITATLGLFVSLAVVLGIKAMMSDAAFKEYGWRIPFLLSIILVPKTGNIYAGLYWVMAVALMTFIVGSIALKESNRVQIWREAEAARPAAE
jgi:hypothetical protein